MSELETAESVTPEPGTSESGTSELAVTEPVTRGIRRRLLALWGELRTWGVVLVSSLCGIVAAMFLLSTSQSDALLRASMRFSDASLDPQGRANYSSVGSAHSVVIFFGDGVTQSIKD